MGAITEETPAPPAKFDIEMSSDDARWQHIMTVEGIAVAREMAKTLLREQVRHGLFFARVRPSVSDVFIYNVDPRVIESGVH